SSRRVAYRASSSPPVAADCWRPPSALLLRRIAIEVKLAHEPRKTQSAVAFDVARRMFFLAAACGRDREPFLGQRVTRLDPAVPGRGRAFEQVEVMGIERVVGHPLPPPRLHCLAQMTRRRKLGGRYICHEPHGRREFSCKRTTAGHGLSL